MTQYVMLDVLCLQIYKHSLDTVTCTQWSIKFLTWIVVHNVAHCNKLEVDLTQENSCTVDSFWSRQWITYFCYGLQNMNLVTTKIPLVNSAKGGGTPSLSPSLPPTQQASPPFLSFLLSSMSSKRTHQLEMQAGSLHSTLPQKLEKGGRGKLTLYNVMWSADVAHVIVSSRCIMSCDRLTYLMWLSPDIV